MKSAFIYSRTKISGRLTKFWTGSHCYHVGFVSDDGWFYDQHWIFRKRRWDGLYDPANVILVDTPVPVDQRRLDAIVEEERARLADTFSGEHSLESLLDLLYGWRDYLAFALRPVYHLFGRSTPNFGGIICSERVGNILIACGWRVRFPEVPSPAGLEVAILGRKDAINE